MTTAAFEKEVFLKAQLVKKNDSLQQKRSLELEKKYQLSINGKKKLKRLLSCLFGRRRKVQVLCCRSAQRLSLQHLTADPTPNIAELVPSGFAWFFCVVHGFCGSPNKAQNKV